MTKTKDIYNGTVNCKCLFLMFSIHPGLNSEQREVALEFQEEYNEKIYRLLLWVHDHEEKDVDAAVSNFSFKLGELILISSFNGEGIQEVLKTEGLECLGVVEVENFYDLFIKTQEYVDLIISGQVILGYTLDYKHILACKKTSEESVILN